MPLFFICFTLLKSAGSRFRELADTTLRGRMPEAWGDIPMSNPRNRILASTALALVLAAPLGYFAKGHLAAMAATSAEPAATQFAPATVAPTSAPAAGTPANEPGATPASAP